MKNLTKTFIWIPIIGIFIIGFGDKLNDQDLGLDNTLNFWGSIIIQAISLVGLALVLIFIF
jgi:hypothetical protein